MDSRKFLIIGGGAVVTEYYLPAFDLLNSLAEVFVIDTSARAIDALRRKFPDVKCRQADFRDFLKALSGGEGFFAAIIALPNFLHTEAVELSLQSALHVLCEKPLVMDEQGCLRMGRLAEKSGKTLAVGMVRRLLPAHLALQEAIKDGLIGQLQGIDLEYGEPYAWLSDSGFSLRPESGGILTDMGVHYLDFIEEIAGALRPVNYCDDYRGGGEANCEFNLVSEGGIPVRLALSRTRLLRNTASFIGESGELILEKDTFSHCKWVIYRSGRLISSLAPKENFRGGKWPADLTSSFAEQIFEFREVIRGLRPPAVNAYRAARTMRLIDWAYNNRQNKFACATAGVCSPPVSARPAFDFKQVTVTGGTGFIGGALIERLADLGCSRITVPVRHYKTCQAIARFPLSTPRTNLLDYNQVREVVAGSQAVFHLAYGREGPEAARVTIKGTENVVNAAIACNAECVVVMSTMYVFGHPPTDKLVDESWPYNPAGREYGRSKVRMEQWCLSRAKNSGKTRIVVLNPSCVFGPNGKTYTQLPVILSREGRFCWVDDGRGIANYTFIDNLIDAIILAAKCAEAGGERFIISDGFCTWQEFLTPLLGNLAPSLPSFSKEELSVLNRRTRSSLKELMNYIAGDLALIDIINRMPFLGTAKRFLLSSFPGFYLALMAARDQAAKPRECIDDASKPVPAQWLGDLFGPTQTKFSAQKAKNILGWSPLVPLAEGQLKARAWLEYAGIV